MPHLPLKNQRFSSFFRHPRGGAWHHVFTGLLHAAVYANPPVNRWPMMADSKNIFDPKGAPRMGLRAFFFVAAVLAGSSQVAEAAEGSPLRRVSCTVVRFYVAKYTQGAAEAWARSKGATEAEIDSARRCLKGSTIITAGY
jgi:hypothetical protein